MARRPFAFRPFEFLILAGLGLAAVYGLVSWTQQRSQCQAPPGSLLIAVPDGSDMAYLRGTMMGEANCKLRRLARAYPGVRTLVLTDIPGTFDLVDTQAATRFLRAQGWNTLVPGNGRIASGGVMLFLGGVGRTVEPGGQVGVHAWSQTWQGAVYSSPDDIPARLERVYRDIYRDLGVDPGFYDFQVEAAPAEDIYWMSRAEMRRWGLI